MTKKKEPKKPHLASVHNLEDFRPIINIERCHKLHVTEKKSTDVCLNYPAMIGHAKGTTLTFAVFDDADEHGVTDLVSIQPSTEGDYVTIDSACCTSGFALRPRQVLALISALQAAYREMSKKQKP